MVRPSVAGKGQLTHQYLMGCEGFMGEIWQDGALGCAG